MDYLSYKKRIRPMTAKKLDYLFISQNLQEYIRKPEFFINVKTQKISVFHQCQNKMDSAKEKQKPVKV